MEGLLDTITTFMVFGPAAPVWSVIWGVWLLALVAAGFGALSGRFGFRLSALTDLQAPFAVRLGLLGLGVIGGL
jgi:hypothetical protein